MPNTPPNIPPNTSPTAAPAPARRAEALWGRVLFLGLIAVGLTGLFFFRDVFAIDMLSRHRDRLMAFRDANITLAMVSFVIGYAAMVTLSLPGATLASLTGGFLFGLLPGLPMNLAAASLGAMGVFLAARAGYGARFADRIAEQGGKAARLQATLKDNDWAMLLSLRLLPAVPFFLANLIPAFVGVPFHRYAITTALGILPGTAALTWIGSGLGEVLDRGEMPDLSLLTSLQVVIPVLLVVTLLLLPFIVRQARARRGRPD